MDFDEWDQFPCSDNDFGSSSNDDDDDDGNIWEDDVLPDTKHDDTPNNNEYIWVVLKNTKTTAFDAYRCSCGDTFHLPATPRCPTCRALYVPVKSVTESAWRTDAKSRRAFIRERNAQARNANKKRKQKRKRKSGNNEQGPTKKQKT